MIKEELKHIDHSESAISKFVLLVGFTLIVVATFLLNYSHNTAAIIIYAVAIILFLLKFISPKLLSFVHTAWMMLALILGWIMTKIILTILFFIVVTSIGIITKFSRKNFLDLNRGNGSPTYWNKRCNSVKVKNYYERQY